MLNVYLHHFLDRPWRRDRPAVPLVRVADDLLVLCRGNRQAGDAHGHLRHLLLPAGMPLKGTAGSAVHDLGRGESADWLGFAVRMHRGRLAAGIAERSWARLGEYLALAHTKGDAPLRAMHTVRQWLNQRGPSYAWSDRAQVCQQVVTCAHRHAFEEISGLDELQARWQRAYARWCKLRKKVRAVYQATGATR
jgi:hypothetical protein